MQPRRLGHWLPPLTSLQVCCLHAPWMQTVVPFIDCRHLTSKTCGPKCINAVNQSMNVAPADLCMTDCIGIMHLFKSVGVEFIAKFDCKLEVTHNPAH